jgi:hypothetical protein
MTAAQESAGQRAQQAHKRNEAARGRLAQTSKSE